MDHYVPKRLEFEPDFADSISMLLNTHSYRSFLTEELSRRIKANPRYSQRAFARDLGLSPGELSEILSEKRMLSHKAARKIAQSLNLNPAETNHLHLLVESRVANTPSHLPPREMSLDMFHLISDWYCMAILNLADVEGFSWAPKWISEKLGISSTEARVAIDRLKRVGLVQEVKGRLQMNKEHLFTPNGIPSEAIRNYHRQILQLAGQALDLQAPQDREISGIGLALDERHIPAIKKEISEFLDHVVSKYSRGKKTVVYQLEAAFFRLGKGGSHA